MVAADLPTIGGQQAELDGGRESHEVARQGGECGGRDEGPGAAIVDDVGGFLGREMRVDHRVVEARALQPERHFVGPVVVGSSTATWSPGPQAMPEQGLGQPAGALLELGKRDHPPRRGDDGRPVRGDGGVDGGAEPHGRGVAIAGSPPPSSPTRAGSRPRRMAEACRALSRWGLTRRPARSPPSGGGRRHRDIDPNLVTTRTYCTILSTNYLPKALALAESLRRHEDGATLNILFIDHAQDDGLPELDGVKSPEHGVARPPSPACARARDVLRPR